MKHTYTKITGKVFAPNLLQGVQKILMGLEDAPKNPDDIGKIDQDFGLCFVPENNDYEHCVKVTPREVLDKYITNNNEKESFFETFFGKMRNPDSGFVDNWNNDLYKDENVHIYYTLMDDGIHEFIITPRKDGFKLSPLYQKDKYGNVYTHLLYLININNVIYDCTPEVNDIIFDTKEEAQEFYPKYKEYKEKLWQEGLKLLDAIKKQKDFESKVESLGDGTYIGQMVAHKFYYQGNEYISPVGIRTSHIQNVILDIKDGKVTIRNWGTPYDKWLKK